MNFAANNRFHDEKKEFIIIFIVIIFDVFVVIIFVTIIKIVIKFNIIVKCSTKMFDKNCRQKS